MDFLSDLWAGFGGGLLPRLVIDLVCVFVLIRVIYYRTYQRTDLFLTFFSFNLVIFLIGFVLNKTIGFRVSEEEELAGVDESEHAETSYDLGTFGAGARGLSYAGSTPSQVEEDTKKNGQEVSA